jgi:hypothetical protein
MSIHRSLPNPTLPVGGSGQQPLKDSTKFPRTQAQEKAKLAHPKKPWCEPIPGTNSATKERTRLQSGGTRTAILAGWSPDGPDIKIHSLPKP